MSADRTRPRILVFVRHYLPGYKSGGPIRSVANIAEALGDECDFRIVTSDRDATDPEAYPGVVPGAWQSVGRARVRYLAPHERGLRTIARIMREAPHDTLYLNSFFDPVFTQRPLLARRLGLAPESRCVIAPRGEFSEGALTLKTGRKRAYLAAARAGGIYRKLTWQASSVHETADISRIQGALARDVRVAADLPRPPETAASGSRRERPAGAPLRLCFLSRISPMKNLDFALSVLQEVGIPLRFNIYGPLRDRQHWARCRDMIGRLPPSIEVRYEGGIDYERVGPVLAEHDLFFLPTRGENFGHVIYEALAAGTPVLISDRTPWRGMAEAGVGWDLPLDSPRSFVEKIEHMSALDESARRAMRESALGYALSHWENGADLEANRSLFREMRTGD